LWCSFCRPEKVAEKEPEKKIAEKPKPAAKKPAAKKTAPKKKKTPEPDSDDMEESSEEQDDNEESEEDSFDDESSDEERELDMETFDTQTLVKDEEDRKYLDSLPELEREGILAERFEELKNKEDMKKALRESKRKQREEKGPAKGTRTSKRKAAEKAKAPPKKKAKASDTANDAEIAASLTDRGTGRNRDATGAKGKKAAALAALRQERKSAIAARGDESEEDESDFGDDSEDSDDDYEEGTLKPWQQKKGRTRVSQLDQMSSDESMDEEPDKDTDLTQAEAPPAELEDIKKVTIPRRRLARWCNEPFFKQAVVGSFVRLFLGEDDNGEKKYRVCQIDDLVKGEKTYNFPVADRREKPVSTGCSLTGFLFLDRIHVAVLWNACLTHFLSCFILTGRV